MSDFNPLDRAKIPTHRSSFDLSSKKLFTAKVGEILPCYWQIATPDTKYRISSDWFTRTVPVNTAAYTRIKEYYDFYAVGEYGPVHFRPHYHLLLFTNSEKVSEVLRYCHDKSWKLGRSDFQRSAGGAGSYVASYVNCLCASPLLIS